MPLIQYREIKLRPKALATIEQANEIIAEFQAQGFDLTLRQLFYQFVARGLIANTQREYKNLGSIVNDGRLAGLIDWETIVDRTRDLRALPHWDSPESIVQACARQFNFDLWEDQPHYVEVWIEKDALVGVIEGVCNRLDVPHFSCRGYTSQSEMWVAAQRIIQRAGGRGRMTGRRPCTILHLGDHDPSGLDMTRDIQDRLDLFGTEAQVVRLALNQDQVREHNPPPNPAKVTDSRAASYIRRFGRESWELDALDPRAIADLIEVAIRERLDADRWDEAMERQSQARALLSGAAKNWSKVMDVIRENGGLG